MSVKGMMQTCLVTELKQIQPDISNESLQYVVDNFSQMFDVREILAEENQELFQSNKNLTTALQKVSDYNLRLEESNKSFISALAKAEAYISQLEDDRDKYIKLKFYVEKLLLECDWYIGAIEARGRIDFEEVREDITAIIGWEE